MNIINKRNIIISIKNFIYIDITYEDRSIVPTNIGCGNIDQCVILTYLSMWVIFIDLSPWIIPINLYLQIYVCE